MRGGMAALAMAIVATACGGGTSGPTVATTTTSLTATSTTTTTSTDSWFNGITAGTCFDDVWTDTGEFDFSLPPPIVPCEAGHDNEVVALVSLGQDDYPDDPAAQAETACALAHADFLGRPIGTTLLAPWQVYPSEEAWGAGVRHAMCALRPRYSFDRRMRGTARSGDLTVPGEALALVVTLAGSGGEELWIVDTGIGEVVANLTTPDSPEPRGTPSWSPDASALATSAWGGGDDPLDIFLINLTTGESVVHESPGNDEGAVISPSGTVLAYHSDRDGYPLNIYVDDLDAETTRQLTIGSNPDWSPDGERIAFHGSLAEGTTTLEIYVIDVASGEITQLTDDPGTGNIHPRWSPDGSQILFSSYRGESQDLWVMDADGSNQTRLTDHPAGEYSPTWSSDGRFIAFETDRLGITQVWVMRADGSDQSLVIGEHSSALPAFGPAGALAVLG